MVIQVSVVVDTSNHQDVKTVSQNATPSSASSLREAKEEEKQVEYTSSPERPVKQGREVTIEKHTVTKVYYCPRDAEKELSIYRRLSPHPNLLTLLSSTTDPNPPNHVSLLFPRGVDFLEVLLLRKRIPPLEASHYLLDLARGVDHLHTHHSIVHGDIKLENCLLLSGKLVVYDFDLSMKWDPNRVWTKNSYGTESYCSPELLRRRPSCNPFLSDAWSIGICFFAMLSGTFPFKMAHQSDSCFLHCYLSLYTLSSTLPGATANKKGLLDRIIDFYGLKFVLPKPVLTPVIDNQSVPLLSEDCPLEFPLRGWKKFLIESLLCPESKRISASELRHLLESILRPETQRQGCLPPRLTAGRKVEAKTLEVGSVPSLVQGGASLSESGPKAESAGRPIEAVPSGRRKTPLPTMRRECFRRHYEKEFAKKRQKCLPSFCRRVASFYE